MWRTFGAIVAANLVARVLLALGMGLVIFVGLGYVLEQISAAIQGYMQGLPADLVGLLGLTDIDLVVNMVISAYSARVAMAQLSKFRII